MSSSGPPESKTPAGDVRALLDKANVAGQRYRTFAPAKAPVTQPKENVRAKVAEAPPVTVVKAAPEAATRRALNSVFAVNSKLTVGVPRTRLSPGSGATLGFASCAGGAGKTTLCATTARILSARLANVLLADRCYESIIPFFFSLDRQGAGGLQTVFPNARRTGYQMTLVAAPSTEPAHSPTGSWLKQLQGESLVTLMDFPTFQSAAVPEGWDRTCQVVVPLLPDVQSIASIARMEEMLQGQDESQKQLGRTLFVLNRFDETRPLHREIRTHLENLLENRLAPVAIRECAYVPEALSLSMTVVDHVPQAPITAEYEQVAAWLEEQLVAAGLTAQEVEIA